MMTDHQVKLIQDSFARIAPNSEQAAAIFYDHLFEIAPDVRPLFASDLAEQGRKLIMTLGVIVNSLGDIEQLLDTVRDLGLRHAADYGVRPEYYGPVGEALLWTLGHGLGPRFTIEVATAWSSAYELVAATMIGATDQAVR
jgi:nitric oxide dioxygenase